MEASELKVLMISSDRNILAPESGVGIRIKEYARLVQELHIVLLSDSSHGLKATQLGSNIWIHPTSSVVNFLRPLGAVRLGKKIIFDKKFVRGKSLITADSIECGWAGLQIKKRWRIPLEVQLHTDILSPYFKGFQNRVRQVFAGRVLSGADSIRVVTDSLGQRIARVFSLEQTKFNTLPIYVDVERIKQSRASFDLHARFGWHFILLTVARLSVEKNLGLLLKAFALVSKQFPETGLVIVGSGPEDERLKRLAEELGVHKHVAFVGWQTDLASYYQTANTYVQTSFFEGYGMSLVEAGLSGLPIVTTKVGIAEDFVNGKDAYLCDPTREAFARAIADLIEHNMKREELKRNIVQTLEAKLISKEEYLRRLKSNWEKVSLVIPL